MLNYFQFRMFFAKGVDESPDAVPDPALLNSCDIEKMTKQGDGFVSDDR